MPPLGGEEISRKLFHGLMTPIVDQKALDDFIETADLDEVRRVEACLTAMASAVRLRAVELETRRQVDFTPRPVSVRGR